MLNKLYLEIKLNYVYQFKFQHFNDKKYFFLTYNILNRNHFQGVINKMHKSISEENYELSVVQADDYYLAINEKLKFYDQCKITIRKKNGVANLGMLIFTNCLSKKIKFTTIQIVKVGKSFNF